MSDQTKMEWSYHGLGQVTANGRPVCDVFSKGLRFPSANATRKGEIHATAELIAAAPDMYEALDEIMRMDKSQLYNGHEVFLKAFKALKKAQGK